MDNLLKNIESTTVLNNSLSKLIEVFISFYGEESREEITKRFNNMVIMGFYNNDDFSRMVEKLISDKNKEFLELAFKKSNMEYSDENRKKYLKNMEKFKSYTSFPIAFLYEYISLVKNNYEEKLRNDENIDSNLKDMLSFYKVRYGVDGTINMIRKRAVENAKNISNDITDENIDDLIKTGSLDYMYTLGKNIAVSFEEYQEYEKNNLQKYIELEKKVNKAEKAIKDKYFLDYLEEFSKYLNDEDKIKLNEMINSGEFLSFKISGLNKSLGIGLEYLKPIEYFSSENEFKLNDQKTLDYERETIIRNRIEYFNYRGINLGNDYNKYLENEECRKIFPSVNDIDFLIDKIDIYQQKQNNDLAHISIFYLDAMNKINQLGLLDKEGILTSSSFENKQTCIYPNIIKQGNKYELYPFVQIYSGLDNRTTDAKIIHELNHYIELSLINANDNEYHCVTGWDEIKSKINDSSLEDDGEFRKYEKFNEIINELISQKITKIMHDNGIFILSDESDYKNRCDSGYEISSFLVKEFLDEYLDDIICSRKNNNIHIIHDKVGKENFEKLNNLIHEFYEELPELSYYRAVDDMRKGKDTELTKKYNNLINKKNEILKEMNIYSLENDKNNNMLR